MKKIIAVFAVLALTLALATTAYGQSSVQGYNDQAGQVQSEVTGTQQASGGSLPFTGLDVALFAGAGALLGAAGFGMRRLTRSPDGV